MKYLFITIFSFFYYTISIFGQIENPNELYEDLESDLGIKGNVLKLTLSSYNAVNKFGQLEKTGDLKHRLIFYFNVHNKIDTFFTPNENIIYNYNNGRFLHELINNKWLITKLIERKHKVEKSIKGENVYADIYKYDNNENVIEHTKYRNDTIIEKKVAKYFNNKLLSLMEFEESGQLRREATYTYDEKGRIIQEVSFNNFAYYSEYKYVYSSNGLLDKKLSYEQNGDVLGETRFRYNSSGILSEENYLNKKEPELNSITKYIYNTKGKLINKYIYYPDGKKELIESNLYDRIGRRIEHVTDSYKETCIFNNLGFLTKKTNTYYKHKEVDGVMQKIIYAIYEDEYFYDLNGNWIKKIESHTDDKSKTLLIPDKYSVTERIISYR